MFKAKQKQVKLNTNSDIAAAVVEALSLVCDLVECVLLPAHNAYYFRYGVQMKIHAGIAHSKITSLKEKKIVYVFV